MNTMKPTAIMQEKIWIKCMRCGFIPQLHMQGPIITPVQVSRQVAHQMIVAGLTVHQIDPDTKHATELNLQNVFPGEGDPVIPNKKESHTPSSGVNSEPINPVDLKGVAPSNPTPPVPPIQEKNNSESKSGVSASTPISLSENDPKDDTSEKQESKDQNNTSNNNGNKNNQNHKNNKKHK